jgi:hypothetical protein
LFLLVGISCTDHSNGYWSVHEIPITGNNVQ